MEGENLSCVKYLMFIFNFIIFLGGIFLLGLGLWVIVDPTDFREIIATNPLLFMGNYLVLAMGAMLFFLGFLGCCGAMRENKCLLLFFFMFILVIFLAELSASILAYLFRENLTRDFFARELKKHYHGNNSTDIFTSTWNSVMVTFECCGVNGPEDFGDTLHFKAHWHNIVPEACCQRGVLQRDTEMADKTECMKGMDINSQGCYSTVLNSLEPYIYIAGALAIGIMAVELLAMIFAMCLFRGIQ